MKGPIRKGDKKVRPFLKWAGGKSSLIESFEALRYIPHHFNNYYEPFLGGGAMFFHLFNQGKIEHDVVLSDVNEELINLYSVVRGNLNDLLEILDNLKMAQKATDYRSCRDTFNELKRKKTSLAESDKITKAALMLYLNKTCYNGLYRENKDGAYNVPFGKHKNIKLYDKQNIELASEALEKVKLCVSDYSACSIASKNDFVYLDPPYYTLSDSSNFTSYDQDDFGEKNHRELAKLFFVLNAKGVKLLLSNSKLGEVEKLFKADGIDIITILARRYINCKGSERKPVEEYVIKNYPTEQPRKLNQTHLPND